MIKKFIQAAALVAAFTGGAAHAATYDFSYTFADGLALTGSLDGTLSGALVNNISNVNVTFNGTAFSGTLLGGTFNSASGAFDFGSAPVVSTNASLNNFVFADSADPTGNGLTNEFYFVNGASPSQSGGNQEVFVANDNILTNNADFDNPASGTWSLTAATPVPLPAGLPLLLSGLGVLGVTHRRRAKARAARA